MTSVVPPPGAANPAALFKAPKSTRQKALEEALAAVKQVASGNPGAAVLKKIREQRAVAAQERLGRAQERYELLHKTMVTVLRLGDGRSAVRLAKDAAAVARDVAGAVKDIAVAAKDGALGDGETRRGILDGVLRQARRIILGVRNLVDAGRIAHDGAEGSRLHGLRTREIAKSRRDTDDALAHVLRDIAAARLSAPPATGRVLIDA